MRLYRLSYAALLLSLPVILAAQPVGKARYGGWGVDLKDMDTGVKPGDDFFRYVEGHWLKTADIASDKARAGYNYDLPDATEIEVRDLVQQAGAAPSDPIMRQVGDSYAAFMDRSGIEQRGLAPLQPYLRGAPPGLPVPIRRRNRQKEAILEDRRKY